LALLVLVARQEQDVPHYQYMMYRYFSDATKANGVRSLYAPLIAASDTEAVSEAKKYGPMDDPLWFELRKVWKKESQGLYDSRTPS
jgi:hypothetical protein